MQGFKFNQFKFMKWKCCWICFTDINCLSFNQFRQLFFQWLLCLTTTNEQWLMAHLKSLLFIYAQNKTTSEVGISEINLNPYHIRKPPNMFMVLFLMNNVLLSLKWCPMEVNHKISHASCMCKSGYVHNKKQSKPLITCLLCGKVTWGLFY